MENIVLNAKGHNLYFVKYPYGQHLDFYATSYKSLKDGLNYHKWSYKPIIYKLEDWYNLPKFKKLTAIQTKTIYEELKK